VWTQPAVKQMSLRLETAFPPGNLPLVPERAAGKEGRASGVCVWGGGGELISCLQSNSYVNMSNTNPCLTLSMLALSMKINAFFVCNSFHS
jgi:hypothetical protein